MTQGDNSGFGGLYDKGHALIHYGKFSAEAKYVLQLGTPGNFKSYSLNGYAEKANLWFRPISQIEIAFGNDYKQALPGAFMYVYDHYSPNGIYGNQYIGANFYLGPVTLGLNIPQMTLGDNFSMKINLGLNWQITKGFNLGAAYKMDKESLSIFANYGGINNFAIGGGVTINGEPIQKKSPIFYTNVSDATVIDFTLLYKNGNNMLGGDFEITVGDDITPMYIGGVGAIGLGKNWSLKADAKYYVVMGIENVTPWALDIHPRVIFSTGKDRIIAGIKFEFQSSGIKDAKTASEFYIPVSWKHWF